MSWATCHIERLLAGETGQFRPHGGSMSGRIESGQVATVEPATAATVDVDDIVLCKVHGSQFLHIVNAPRGDGRCQIGNNRGGINGWTSTYTAS